MAEKTIKATVVQLPEGVSEELRRDVERAARYAAVLALWESGDISARLAASELDVPYDDFLNLLAEAGIPVAKEHDPASMEKARRLLMQRGAEQTTSPTAPSA